MQCKMVSLKYSGPVAIIIGIIVITVFILFNSPTNNKISAWLIWDVLTISQVLPLAGLGLALSFVSRRLVLLSILAFVVGYFITFMNYSKLWVYFVNSSDISKHLYLTLPIASFCSGILLISSSFLRKYLILPISFVVSAMLSITVKLTDPTLYDPIIPQLGLIISIWIILSIMLSARSFYRSWFHIAIKILGSWLLASSLLYGGTAFAVKYGVIKQEKSSSTPTSESTEDEDLFIPDFT